MAKPFRDLFVSFPCTQDGGASPALDAALALAGTVKAHVSVQLLGMSLLPPFGFAGGFAGGMAAELQAREQALVVETRDALRARLEGHGLSHDVQACVDDQTSLLAAVSAGARLHDLAIADRTCAGEGEALGAAMVEELLFHSGRPVLLVPPAADASPEARIAAGAAWPRSVTIAWDCSARAARAVNDALPFLSAAEQVEVVCVNSGKGNGRSPGAELAPHLARHGIAANVVDIAGSEADAGEIVRERAARTGTQLIVMGAFGHSRFRQFLLGGVTSSMLRHASVPVLMSH
jgi:nucleotide-binding universal stress UspA family protein